MSEQEFEHAACDRVRERVRVAVDDWHSQMQLWRGDKLGFDRFFQTLREYRQLESKELTAAETEDIQAEVEFLRMAYASAQGQTGHAEWHEATNHLMRRLFWCRDQVRQSAKFRPVWEGLLDLADRFFVPQYGAFAKDYFGRDSEAEGVLANQPLAPESTNATAEEAEESARGSAVANEDLTSKVLRSAIAKLGREAKPEAVIAEAHVRKAEGRRALRILEASGEYAGFSRRKPARYQRG